MGTELTGVVAIFVLANNFHPSDDWSTSDFTRLSAFSLFPLFLLPNCCVLQINEFRRWPLLQRSDPPRKNTQARKGHYLRLHRYARLATITYRTKSWELIWETCSNVMFSCIRDKLSPFELIGPITARAIIECRHDTDNQVSKAGSPFPKTGLSELRFSYQENAGAPHSIALETASCVEAQQ